MVKNIYRARRLPTELSEYCSCFHFSTNELGTKRDKREMCQLNSMTRCQENFVNAKRYWNGIKEELKYTEHWSCKYGIKCNRKTHQVIQVRANKNYYSLETSTPYI